MTCASDTFATCYRSSKSFGCHVTGTTKLLDDQFSQLSAFSSLLSQAFLIVLMLDAQNRHKRCLDRFLLDGRSGELHAWDVQLIVVD